MFISFVGVAEFLRTVSSFEIRKEKVKSKKKDKAHGASTIQMALSKGDGNSGDCDLIPQRWRG